MRALVRSATETRRILRIYEYEVSQWNQLMVLHFYMKASPAPDG